MHRLQVLPFFIMGRYIYLDESGDLGWTFNKPYGAGGSSRFLTIAYLSLPPEKKHLPKRVVRKAYKKFNFKPSREKKGSELKATQIEYLTKEVKYLLQKHTDIQIGCVTVKKSKVQKHIRDDSNKLYNWMICLSLIDFVKAYDEVLLVPDNKSIKVASGNSLEDYLQIKLWFELNSKTKLKVNPQDSNNNLNLIFIDWIVHIIWSNFEYNKKQGYMRLAPLIEKRRLFMT